MPVVDLLAPRPGERILDLGCGDGALTEKLAAAGCDVVGADASAELVKAARARGLDARLMNGEALDFDGEFDAVFSNAALHWMLRPDAVIDGVYRALKPGGRFVGEFGGAGNVATIASALEAALDRRGLRRQGREPLVLSKRRGIRGETGRARLPGAVGGADRTADAAADRHGGLARDLRRKLHRQGPRERAWRAVERGAGGDIARPE